MAVLHRFTGKGKRMRWTKVTVEQYKKEGAVGSTKHVLIGNRDGAANFSLRYYEVASGGKTSFDRHDHDHGVYVLRGRASVMVGLETLKVRTGDVLYILPNEQHQFENIGSEPFGFLCAVPPRD